MKPLNLIKSLTFSITLLATNFSFSQKTEIEIRRLARTGSEQEILVGSSELLQENYFYLAEILIDKLLTYNPTSCNYNYRKGFVLLALNENYEKAIAYLEKAIENTDKNYDMYSSNEKSASTDALFHLAKSYHMNNQLDLAIQMYQQFIQNSERKSPLLVEASLRLEQCNHAKTVINNPTVSISGISNTLNTKKSEYASVVSFDGKTIYFTSKRQWFDKANESDKDESTNDYFEDIYFSQKSTDTSWSKPKKLDFCLPERNEASVGITLNERQLFIYNDVAGEGDIFETAFENGSFGIPKTINEESINTASWETHFCLSADQKKMYFVSNKPGGFGGRDIYKKELLADGNWSEPINLGPSINTAFDEESPFLSFDNETLYFSSNGKASMGGFDVFYSKIENEKNYSLSVNLGTPVNSTCDDLFFTLTADNKIGFLSSNRKNGKGEKDIYQLQFSTSKSNAHLLKAKIINKKNTTLPESFYVTLKCTNCKTNEVIEYAPRITDGMILAPLNACSKYKISFKKDKYSTPFHEEDFQTNCNSGYEEITKEYTIDFNTFELVPFKELKRRIKITDEQNQPIEGVTVEIIAKNSIVETVQTDNKGEISLNFLKLIESNDSLICTYKLKKENYISNVYEFRREKKSTIELDETYQLFKNIIGQDLSKLLKLNPIYYSTGSFEIMDESKKELDKIIELLNNNEEINIELGSHTDCRGDEKKNLILSKKRAEKATQYIQQKIKNPTRINGIGYGENKLLISCPCDKKSKTKCSEEEHQQNRRTEFRIIKK
jgi:outer membrane protein OmpA-like peptidoglycan-associated protein